MSSPSLNATASFGADGGCTLTRCTSSSDPNFLHRTEETTTVVGFGSRRPPRRSVRSGWMDCRHANSSMVWRAISLSSSVRMTRTGIREASALIMPSPRAFLSASSMAPAQPQPSTSSARVAASFSPIPRENTMPSSPPRAAVSDPISRTIRWTKSAVASPAPDRMTHAKCAYPTIYRRRPASLTSDRSDPRSQRHPSGVPA